MEKSNPVRMLCTYQIKDGKEAEFERMLEKHWPTLHGMGLATDEPARVFRGQNKARKIVYIEMFSWKDASSPDVAHQTPEVMAVWEPMGALTDNMDFWMIETVAMPLAQS